MDRPQIGRRITSALVVLVLIGVVGALALGFRRDPHDIKTGTIGKSAPALDLPRLDGSGLVRSADYAGQVVVLNFWASWCVPCKEENPALAAAWERYRGSGAMLIGVVYQDSADAAAAYTTRLGNTWPSVVDADGRVAIAYGVFGIPETFFIGPDGIIAGRHIGPIDLPTLVEGIETIRARP